MLTDVTLAVLGVLAVAAGGAVFTVDSMARATYALLASFLAVAGIVLTLDLTYLAVVTALMMTMEMAIMGVFMVMFMMNPGGLMPMTMMHNTRGAAAVGVAVFALLTTGIWTIDWPDARGRPSRDSTHQLAEALMGSHMLVMVVVAAALFATIIAGTVLATHRGRYDRFGPNLDARPPRDPIPGGLPR
ncbi:NADH-quinone oxidoreductase subunit J [Phytoactinopolyspora halotolerans]|uniref:NADH-quinone oxidoreductase subunit J n=1 Tax=Phytoactinopolyspora halotolerans TaxID=1981512 RepID=A0A6L9SBR3_9ACTN|nr:NADH-quinone oxidoreductase subunit J [Phytoactinopolyspora halotolerans]NEE02042.1 NADH:ubiquinone oxidoreductase subunit J [Phytoactinopolyspora halotolerans]